MVKKSLSILLILFILFSFNLKIVKSDTVSIQFGYYYYPFDGTSTSGTPFAVFVNFSGQANTQYRVTGYFYSGSTSSGYIWHLQNNNWFLTPGTTSSRPYITTDGSGNWKGWLVFKSNSGTSFGGSVNFRVRFYLTANIDDTLTNVNLMNMSTSGNGGWIEGYANLDGNPAQNKIVVVKNSSGTIIGIYITEDNGVNEGYSSTPGYFKVGVPAGCNYTVELWDPTTNTIYPNGSVSNVCVNAGVVTTGITINAVSNNSPTLSWTGETGYETDGVEPDSGLSSTNFEFRIKYSDIDNDPPKSGYPKVHILKDGSEILGSPFTMEEVDPSDTNYSDGKLYRYSKTLYAGNYSYYFEAKDINDLNATGEPTTTKIGPTVIGDSVPPTIYNLSPPRFCTTYERRPIFSAKYFDNIGGSGIDVSSIYIKIDGVDKTSEAIIT